MPKDLYERFVGYLYHVYRALEEEARRCAKHELFSAVHFPDEVWRVELQLLQHTVCSLSERGLSKMICNTTTVTTGGQQWKNLAVIPLCVHT